MRKVELMLVSTSGRRLLRLSNSELFKGWKMKWTRPRFMKYSCFLQRGAPSPSPCTQNLCVYLPLHSPLASNSTKASISRKKKAKSFRRRRKRIQEKYVKGKCEENGKTATGAFLTRLSTLWIFYSTNELPIMFIDAGFFLPSCSMSCFVHFSRCFYLAFCFRVVFRMNEVCGRRLNVKCGKSSCGGVWWKQ